MTIRSNQIPVLPRPTWLDKAGMGKGVDHDCQHLGIILAAGQTIKARQTNSAFKGNVILRLLNDGRKTETSKKINSSWVSVSINAVSVPFIDTPYYNKPEDKVEPGDDESALFSQWDKTNADFAFIDSRYTMVLIPARDQDALKHPQGVDNIDGLIAYYDSVFSFDNSLADLSFEPEYDSDLNIPNRYFMKADVNGAGAAYYGQDFTAASEKSIKSWWLDPLATNWGNLHEIAYGYQASFSLGDDIFSTILVDQVNSVLGIAVTRENPHSYFGDQTYAGVIIKDTSGNEKFHATFPGTGAKPRNDKISFVPGYTLVVFHEEPKNRVQLSPTFNGVIDTQTKTNTFEITMTGLKSLSLKNDPTKALLARIEAAVTELRSRTSMLRAECPPKVDIWLAISLFSGSQRDDLLKQSAGCLPSDNAPPTEGLGTSFTVTFQGIGDHVFLTADVDLIGRRLKVRLEAGVANHYFSDTYAYASLKYIDNYGSELLNLDVKGNKDQKAQDWFPFQVGATGC
ncbi:peptidase M60 [Aspergillus affinis]|uniref:peptidase M60 n=1 Tax=Aspergillus affinis TaxID=1070780 RepID=UPI0022FE2303|nr:peptidase M60 [Aspergillus affinis]KAI9040029.1 peptidase M60 [Aspergillus affinis]